MRKPRPVLQLVILSVHLLASRGQGEPETPDTISITCRTYLINQTSDHRYLCQTMETPMVQLCSEEDLVRVCNASSSAANATRVSIVLTISTTTRVPHGELQPHRELQLQLVINVLSARCRSAMAATLKELLQSREGLGCSSLETIESHLISNAICSLGDYENMRSVLCETNVDSRDLVDSVKRKENILILLHTNVSKSCQVVLQTQSHNILDNLDAGCQKLKNAGNSLIIDKSCTAKDLQILLKEACVEKFANDNIQRVAQKELTDKCHLAITSGVTDITGITAEECCGKLKAYKDMLLISDYCTEEDYQKLATVTCARGAFLSTNSLTLYMTLLTTYFFFNHFTFFLKLYTIIF